MAPGNARTAAAAAIVGLLGAVASCALIAGIDAPGERPNPALDATAGDSGDERADADDSQSNASPDCGVGFVCAPPVPSGWAGPIALAAVDGGPPTPALPSCSAPYGISAFTGNAGLDAPPPSCVCACGPVQASCDLSLITSANAAGGCSVLCDKAALMPNQCFQPTGQCASATKSVQFNATPDAGCTPLPTFSTPAATWSESARGCSTGGPQTRCAAGTCAPAPGAGFSSHLCVYRAGTAACPSGNYTQRHLYYGALQDTRDCTPCACAPASGFLCSATLEGFTGAGCTSAVNFSTGANVPCQPDNLSGSFMALAPTIDGGGSCTPSGGQPTGSANGVSSMTVCCAP